MMIVVLVDYYSMLFLLYFINSFTSSKTDPIDEKENNDYVTIHDKNSTTKISPEEMYIKLFLDKRKLHFEAMQSVSKIEVYEKRYKMLNTLFEKIFKVLSESKEKLIEKSFFVGDPFPIDENIRDIYSQVLENTAFFGDLILRQPDMTHLILKKRNDWKILATWAIGFVNETKAFQTSQSNHLHLLSQELGIIEKDKNYVNPYKAASNQASHKDQLLQDEIKKIRKQKKKELKKGPRLSSKNEL